MAKIKDIPKIDHPRERFIKKGADALSKSDLLAILLGSGIRGRAKIDKYDNFLFAVDETRQAVSADTKSSSSLVASQETSQDFATLKVKNVVGGIDLTDRAMHIKLERVGSFAELKLMLPGIRNVETIDLDNEFKQIQAMVSADIRPSDTRILEFGAACYYKGEFDQRLEQVSSCIKAAHLADEFLGKESSDTLRLATILPDALYAYSVN